MQIFISWSGERGQQIANALKALLVTVLPDEDLEIFVSSEMEKGVLWSSQIVQELKRSVTGIICLTPEGLKSNWLHFEAGALTNHLISTMEGSPEAALGHPGIYTYLHQLKPGQLSGPLAAYQSTTTTQEDTKSLIKSIARFLKIELGENSFKNSFPGAWKTFEVTLQNITITIPRLITKFESWFNRKTFNEPLQECTAQSWLDRYNGARDTYLKLKNHSLRVEAACPSYQVDLYEVLQMQADAYAMNLELLLKAEPFRLTEKGEVDIQPPGILHACEMRRKAIKDIVSYILDPLHVPKTAETVIAIN